MLCVHECISADMASSSVCAAWLGAAGAVVALVGGGRGRVMQGAIVAQGPVAGACSAERWYGCVAYSVACSRAPTHDEVVALEVCEQCVDQQQHQVAVVVQELRQGQVRRLHAAWRVMLRGSSVQASVAGGAGRCPAARASCDGTNKLPQQAELRPQRGCRHVVCFIAGVYASAV